MILIYLLGSPSQVIYSLLTTLYVNYFKTNLESWGVQRPIGRNLKKIDKWPVGRFYR